MPKQKPRIPEVFKNVIAPVQAWLLSQERCVGCGRELKDGKKEKQDQNLNKITCTCGRVFMHDTREKKYRRALLDEV